MAGRRGALVVAALLAGNGWRVEAGPPVTEERSAAACASGGEALGDGTCEAAEPPRQSGVAQTSRDPGVVLIQTKSGDLSRVQRRPVEEAAELSLEEEASAVRTATPAPSPVSADTAEDEALHTLTMEVLALKQAVQALHSSVESQVTACCSQPCSPPDTPLDSSPPTTGPGLEPHKPGLCATFGDPHFTTFDGAHTILLAELTLWLVKSKNVWIQAFSHLHTGNLMGIAVGGPFMGGHNLILYNSTTGSLQALYDGKPILESEDQDENGNAEFEAPFNIWAARRSDWDLSIHDQAILEMDQPVNFSVSTWPGRFQDAPFGGLYLFRLPEGIEITATGVDFMSAVIKMYPQKDGQTGYCGNFNGLPDDEFVPAPEGSVPPLLAAAWNVPVGPGLGPVEDSENMFLKNNLSAKLVKPSAVPSFAQLGSTPLAANCTSERMKKAEEECNGVSFPTLFMWKACICDVCLTGKPAAASAIAMAEILEEKVNSRGIPVFVGHGQCVDLKMREFHVLRTKGVRNFWQCMTLLRDVAATQGVLGAQLQVGGSCEIVVEAGVRVQDMGAIVPPHGGWEVEGTHDAEKVMGRDHVAGVKDDVSWSCWRRN